ncbi:PAS domain S-box protein [Salidesulfovibrio onnuriiensis]|uniref:PAS domain S-box protein n=1 Tax=Salidesulfovibrio onnuriiensis TaxID=2583823 RepID=UPI0011CC03EF|nr:PAS domain S-box protein [Salidesulfovibrio onnuriiensis]
MSCPLEGGGQANCTERDMQVLAKRLQEKEAWLMQRILHYAKEYGYTPYTSTLVEAWQVSISGLTDAIVSQIESKGGALPPFGAGDNFTGDPIARFGVLEGQRHRERGIPIGMFLGLLKYYRQTYLDFADQFFAEFPSLPDYRRFVIGCFDRFELGISVEWTGKEDREFIAELQHKNRQVTNQKNQFMTVLESLRSPVFLLDENNLVMHMNEAGARLCADEAGKGPLHYGGVDHAGDVEEQSWMGRPVESLLPFMDALRFGPRFGQQKSFEQQVEVRGELRTYNVDWSSMVDVSDKFSGSVLVFNDVTRRKNVEGQLRQAKAELEQRVEERTEESREAHRKLQAIMDFSPMLISIFDNEGRYLMVNKACSDVIGLPGTEIVGKTFADLLPVEVARTFHARLAKLTGSQQSMMVDDCIDVGGRKNYYSTSLFPLFNDLGQAYAFCGISVDVTLRKRADESFAKVSQQNAMILNAAGEGIFGIGVNGRITFVNPAAAAMLGWDALELTGKSSHKACHHTHLGGSHYPEESCPISRTLATGKPSRGRNEYFWRKDGTSFPVSYKCMPIVEKGRVSGVVVTFSDISEQKRIERELMEARDRAEIASEAKSQFLSNMSHELRTPLNGIVGMVQLLLGQELDPEHREYLEMLKLSSDKLLELLKNLFDLSSIEFGRMERRDSEFGLRKSLEPMLATASVQAKLKGLDFNVFYDKSLPTQLHGDILHLKQALINLLKNAVQYTFAGEISLRVQDAGREAGGVRRIRFIVSDTGIGIPPDKQLSVLENFALGEHYMTKRYSGSGLGLSIAARLVDLLGGSLYLCSEVGAGSSFAFTLEMRECPSRISAGLVEQLSQTTVPMHILYVEDEDANQLLVKTLLDRAGHSVEVVPNGAEALEALSHKEYDLVLMDIQMPVMDGLEATRRIREMSLNVPVIALTAYAGDEDRERFEAVGMDGLLHKPLEISQLMKTLAYHGERRH